MSIQSRHLDRLETKPIYITREVVTEVRNPALLFFGGKDSIVLLAPAVKALKLEGRLLKLPFKLLHVDTGHSYPEVIQFHNETVTRAGVQLMVDSTEGSIKKGTVVSHRGTDPRGATQTVTLVEIIGEQSFDALIGGARCDEEGARMKERIFPSRNEFGQWGPKSQCPELWLLYNTQPLSGENMRMFPISNWTELDIWQYIAHENFALPSIYYSYKRRVVERDGLFIPVIPLTPKRKGEVSQIHDVRFHTIGDVSRICPVVNTATTPKDIIVETVVATISERSATRMDDRVSEAAMEEREKAGCS